VRGKKPGGGGWPLANPGMLGLASVAVQDLVSLTVQRKSKGKMDWCGRQQAAAIKC